jgi:hypothetical protein
MQNRPLENALAKNIINAIQRISLSEVQALVTEANIEHVDPYGYTALAHAISTGNLATVEWLIQKGANIHFKTTSEATALMLASHSSLEIVKYLISLKCSIEDRDRNGDSAFLHTIAYDKVYIAEYFLTQYPNFIEHKNKYGRNIVLEAAYEGRQKLVNYFIQNHKNFINLTNEKGESALYCAINYCVSYPDDLNFHIYKRIIYKLLHHGAKISSNIVKLSMRHTGTAKIVQAFIGAKKFQLLLDEVNSTENSYYPLVEFKIKRSASLSKPFQLIVTQISSSKKSTIFYKKNITPNASFSFADKLSDVSLKVKADGTLIIDSLADNINYHFNTAGSILTNNKHIKNKNVTLDLTCKNFHNRAGKIAVTNFSLDCKQNIDNTHGEIIANQVKIFTGNLLNLHGHIIAKEKDLVIKSLIHSEMKLFEIKNINGGQITADCGKVTIDVKKIITDEESRVWGAKGVEITSDKFRHESILASNEHLQINVENNNDLHAGLLAKKDIHLSQKEKLRVNHKIKSINESVNLKSDLVVIKNKIIAKKQRKFTVKRPENFQYNRGALFGNGDIDITFLQGGIFKQALYNYASITIRVLPGATESLQINNHIVTDGRNLSALYYNGHDINFDIRARIPLILGNTTRLTQLRSLTGSVNVKATFVVIPFAAVTANHNISIETINPITIGDLLYPSRISEMRSDGNCSLKTNASLNTYFTVFDIKNNFTVEAPGNWDAVANQVFIGGKTFLRTPLSTHRILTKTVKSSGNSAKTQLGNIHETRNTFTTEISAGSASPSFMTSELATTGRTQVFGGSFCFLKQLLGDKPLMESFVETIVDEGEFLGGHKKQKNAWWNPPYNRSYPGIVHAASADLGTSQYKKTQLTLPGNYRAKELTITDFDKLLIGNLVNSLIPSTKQFHQVIDVAAEVNFPQCTLQIRKNNPHSIFIDILGLPPKRPVLPRVIIEEDGYRLNLQEKSLYPLSVEAKRVGIAFLKNIGQLPPELNLSTLDLDKLHSELMQNALDYFNVSNQSIRESKAVISQQTIFNDINKPMLVYKKVEFQHEDGTTESGLKYFLVLPNSYEKYYLTAGNSLIANILRLVGNNNSQLHITCKVHGNQLVEVDVTTCLVETSTYHHQQTISQNESTRKLGRKKTRTTTHEVTVSTVREQASLTSDGTLNLTTDTTIQRGSHIGGKQGLIKTKKHIAEPVIEAHVIPYTDKGRILGGIKKVKVWGEVLASSLVPATLDFGSAMQLRASDGEFAAVHAMSLTGNVDMVFTNNLQLKPVIFTQALVPTVTKTGRTLTVTQGSIQRGYNNQLSAFSGNVLLSSKIFNSAATQYFADNMIRIVAQKIYEAAVHLAHHYQTKTSGLKRYGIINERTEQGQQTALTPLYYTGAKGSVEIIAIDEVNIQAPNVHTSKFKIKSKKEVKLTAIYLAHFYESTKNSLTLNFMGARALQALSKGNFTQAFHEFAKEFPVIDSIEGLHKSKDLADLAMRGPRALYHAYRMYAAYQKVSSVAEFIEGQLDLNPSLRLGRSTESMHQITALVPTLEVDEILVQSNNITTKGLKAKYTRSLKMEAKTDLQMHPAHESESYEYENSGITLGVSFKTGKPYIGVDNSTQRIHRTHEIHTELRGSDTELKAGNKLYFTGEINGSKCRLSADQVVLETLQDTENRSNSSMNVSSSGQVQISKGSSVSLWANTQTALMMQDSLEIKAKNLILKGVKLASKKTPVKIEAKNIDLQDVTDFAISKQINIGVDISGYLDKDNTSALKGSIAPEFRRNARHQVNRTYVDGQVEIESQNISSLPIGVSDNRSISSTKKHLGIFLPILSKDKSDNKNILGELQQKDDAIENPEHAFAYREMLISGKLNNGWRKTSNPANLLGDADPLRDNEEIYFQNNMSQKEMMSDAQLNANKEAIRHNDEKTVIWSLYQEPKDKNPTSHEFYSKHHPLKNIPLLGPFIRGVKETVPTFLPSRNLRISGIIYARWLDHELQSIGSSLKLPFDPLGMINSKNILKVQKSLHFASPAISVWNGYSNLNDAGVHYADAFAGSATAVTLAYHASAGLNKCYLNHIPHSTTTIGKFLQGFSKGFLTSIPTSKIIEVIPRYFNLQQSYPKIVSGIASTLGGITSYSIGAAGLGLIVTAVPESVMTPVVPIMAPLSLVQAGYGAYLLTISGDIGDHVSEYSAKILHKVPEYYHQTVDKIHHKIPSIKNSTIQFYDWLNRPVKSINRVNVQLNNIHQVEEMKSQKLHLSISFFKNTAVNVLEKIFLPAVANATESYNACSRPDYASALAAFKEVDGYANYSNLSNIIGGKVKDNIDAGIFQNACAIRGSRLFNAPKLRDQTNCAIPKMKGKTVSGGDGLQYIYRISTLINHLTKVWGPPDYDSRKKSHHLPEDIQGVAIYLMQYGAGYGFTGHFEVTNSVTPGHDVLYWHLQNKPELKDSPHLMHQY